MVNDNTSVQVVNHDPQWVTQFRAEAARLRSLLGPDAVAIHHIGSTSIPAIPAKPIIDILLEVRAIDAVDRYNAALRQMGYEPRGEFGLPRRRYFPKTENGSRTYHVHSWQSGDPEIERHLAFRDYMIAHPNEAQTYGRLKQDLVTRFEGDKERYIDGKDAYCQTIQQRAVAWQRTIAAAAIATERLRLLPLNPAQLWQYLNRPDQLEAASGLRLSRSILVEPVNNAIRTKLHLLAGADLDRLLWHTYWLMIIRDAGFGAGFIGYKGPPDAVGAVEIGYGIDEEVRRQGYTFEAARALVAWAMGRPGVRAVTAWTDKDNQPSVRILEKLGMTIVREEGDQLGWQRDVSGAS